MGVRDIVEASDMPETQLEKVDILQAEEARNATELGEGDPKHLPSFDQWQNNAAGSWWQDKGLRRCIFDIVLLYGAIFANGYDAGVMSSLQANQNWLAYFGNPKGQRLGAVVSAYAFPGLVFPLLGSILSDRWGRKPAIFIASVLGIVGPVLSGVGSSLGTFLAGRLILGISFAFYQVTAPNLIAEIAHPRFRAIVSATFLVTFYVGAFVCLWLGYGMVMWGHAASWRVLTILQCLGSVPLLFWSATPWMSESPRYHVKMGKPELALRTLARLHANDDHQDELVVNEMREIVLAVELDQAAATTSYLDFFHSTGNKKRLWLVLWFSWVQSMSGNNLFTYYTPQILKIAGITNFAQIQGLQAGICGFLLIVGIVAAQLVERVGRRKLVFCSLSSLVVMFSILTGLSGGFAKTGNKVVGITCVPFIALSLAAYSMSMLPLPYMYLPEILPYNLRSKGLAIFSILTAAGAVYNAYVNAIALEAIAWRYYIIFICTDAIELVVGYFLVVETRGLTLEDIAILFDGNETLLAAEGVRP